MSVTRIVDETPPTRSSEAARFRIDNGVLRAEVWEFGATLLSLSIPDGADGRVDVVLGHDRLDDYTDPDDRAGYLGATVGRYANRIANSRFVFDGATVELAPNEGPHHLHGGPDGFDQRRWTAVAGDDDSVGFTLVSPAGDQGYPGTLTSTVRYRLRGSSLELEHSATTDAPTVVGLTNHAYWNLAGGGRVDDHEATVHGRSYLAVDDDQIPTGEIVAVDGTRFDLRRPTSLASIISAGGADLCYLLDATEAMREVAVLAHPPTGRTMRVVTDQPALQFYTANQLPTPYVGVCLETQRAADAPNHPRFGRCALRPGQVYRSRTTHTFGGPGIP